MIRGYYDELIKSATVTHKTGDKTYNYTYLDGNQNFTSIQASVFLIICSFVGLSMAVLALL